MNGCTHDRCLPMASQGVFVLRVATPVSGGGIPDTAGYGLAGPGHEQNGFVNPAVPRRLGGTSHLRPKKLWVDVMVWRSRIKRSVEQTEEQSQTANLSSQLTSICFVLLSYCKPSCPCTFPRSRPLYIDAVSKNRRLLGECGLDGCHLPRTLPSPPMSLRPRRRNTLRTRSTKSHLKTPRSRFQMDICRIRRRRLNDRLHHTPLLHGHKLRLDGTGRDAVNSVASAIQCLCVPVPKRRHSLVRRKVLYIREQDEGSGLDKLDQHAPLVRDHGTGDHEVLCSPEESKDVGPRRDS